MVADPRGEDEPVEFTAKKHLDESYWLEEGVRGRVQTGGEAVLTDGR